MIPDTAVTTYCDQPRHTSTPVGPSLTGLWIDTAATLADVEGVFIATRLERGRDVEGRWAPAAILTARGWARPRRG